MPKPSFKIPVSAKIYIVILMLVIISFWFFFFLKSLKVENQPKDQKGLSEIFKDASLSIKNGQAEVQAMQAELDKYFQTKQANTLTDDQISELKSSAEKIILYKQRTADWIEYDNDKINFKYPADWQVLEVEEGDGGWKLSSPLTDESQVEISLSFNENQELKKSAQITGDKNWQIIIEDIYQSINY